MIDISTICWICLDDKYITSLKCKHHFCTDCLKEYVKLKYFEGKLEFKCPNPNCECLFSDRILKLLLKAKHVESIKCRRTNVKKYNLSYGDINRELYDYIRTHSISKCPCCLMLVEKFGGCDSIKCRCGCIFEFKDNEIGKLLATLFEFRIYSVGLIISVIFIFVILILLSVNH